MRIRDPHSGSSYFSKRRRRVDDGFPRELTFSCFRRIRFLEKDRARHWLLTALEDARSRWPVDLWAWVIMPEHVHLLVSPRDPKLELGRFAGFIKEHSARPAIRWLAEHSPAFLNRITVQEGTVTRRRFWQPGGGYDRNVGQERTLASMIEYIHQNPVRRGLCERPADWEWSSARWYAGVRPALVEIDATLPTIHDC
ncbi:Transposase IS200 like protein [Caulifigura coniformis]|uniref:Transposase IS200 like protein n=1 Tax=Caulifigura coniformis TaxID=2527983 RepID=A0A517SIQ2_9PLAN|nr:transposase [Caulifigura coniformis]QDT56011.1 Transposase IS200 like protein [Caulifigura coniformis]